MGGRKSGNLRVCARARLVHANRGMRTRGVVTNAPLTRRLRSSDWLISPQAVLVGGAWSCEPVDQLYGGGAQVVGLGSRQIAGG